MHVWRRFIPDEIPPGILLIFSAVLAVALANSPGRDAYHAALETGLGGLSALLWINDALMAVFFLLVGLEIKRELTVGALSGKGRAALPLFAALGGMIAPAILYLAASWQSPEFHHGWAIASATDIAFALAVLSLLGPRVPAALKVFLTALAILDDLGAILIIALFYGGPIHANALLLGASAVAMMAYLNRSGARLLWPYLLLGAALWAALLQSGLHPTLAGVVTAFFIPASPAQNLEQKLHAPVVYFILPLFALANSGLDLTGLNAGQFAHPVTLGIIVGLFFGKQAGIFGACLMFKNRLPQGCTLWHVYGAALLGGIGFTMSLFIGSLAFGGLYMNEIRLGVLTASILSALAGYTVLKTRLTQ